MQDIYSKHDLYNILKTNGIHLTKSRGQNFLLDKNLLQKLIRAADIKTEDHIIEIGGGIGHLTAFLASSGAHITVFEIDKKLAALLQKEYQEHPQVEIVCMDFLKANLRDYIPLNHRSVKILANIPYHITTPILEHCFKEIDIINSMILTVQKEFAQRITAHHNDPQYSSLSIYCKAYSTNKLLFVLSDKAFYPQPKVESAAVYFDLTSKNPLNIQDHTLFTKILRAIFSSRRKTIYNSLSKSPFLDLNPEILKKVLSQLEIDPGIRGESLSAESLAKLCNLLYQMS
ncbi:MAG: 16S rRNA (adenine(1518)-N(6)/adenine(1519)-N(6))-dimethyltransferase RsmA [Spirochaetota bacterium]|nr:16S rRNA (adenine(1518)-N(6)/adenine(1519)-N(6))-dimethyltransferase RsmA [Spirochaetota bacterium]